MREQNSHCNDWQTRNKKITQQLGYWTFAWVTTMAIATFGPKFIWDSWQPLTVIAITVNLLIGFGMIWANKRHLKGLDELQQRIQLEAMGLTLGIGLVVGLSYSLLDTTNLISSDAEIPYLVIVMSLSYLAGILLGNRRYQ